MKREFLQNFKIGDQALPKEVIDAIMAENGKDIENAKADLANVQQQLDTAKEALSKFDGVSVDDLNEQITKLKTDLKNQEESYKKQISDRDFDDGLKAAINDAKGKNYKAIRALLDIETLKQSKNQAADIKTALEQIKTDNDYLFNSDASAPPFAAGTGTHGQSDHSDDIDKFRSVLGLKPANDKQ